MVTPQLAIIGTTVLHAGFTMVRVHRLVINIMLHTKGLGVVICITAGVTLDVVTAGVTLGVVIWPATGHIEEMNRTI